MERSLRRAKARVQSVLKVLRGDLGHTPGSGHASQGMWLRGSGRAQKQGRASVASGKLSLLGVGGSYW